MKNTLSLLATVLVMSIFASIIFLKLDAWEKKMKTEVKKLAVETVKETLATENK